MSGLKVHWKVSLATIWRPDQPEVGGPPEEKRTAEMLFS